MKLTSAISNKFKEYYKIIVSRKRYVELFVLMTSAITASLFLYDLMILPVQTLLTHDLKQEKLVNKVKPGTNSAYLNAVLGLPVKISQNNNFQISLYKEDDFWVQSIKELNRKDISAVVITACDGFKPNILLPNSQKIQMNKTLLGDFNESPQGGQYFVRSVTRPTNIYQYYYLAAPGNYQTIALGYVEGCNGSSADPFDDIQRFRKANLNQAESKKYVNKVKINTVLFSGAHEGYDDFLEAFEASENRIDIGVRLTDAKVFQW